MAKRDTENTVEDTIKETSKRCLDIVGLPGIRDWCSTGYTILDIAIANRFPGGIPIGRVIHVFGGGSTAKSVLATIICGYAQRAGMKAYYADVEHTLDPNFAVLYGLDCGKVEMGHPTTIEEFFDIYLSDIIYKKTPAGKIKGLNKDPKIVVVDSITALPTEVELGEGMKDGTFGTSRAKQMSKGFRKYLFAITESNTTLFCIDQTRDNVGAGPFSANKEVTSGGRALEFYSSVQIYLKHDCRIKNSKNSPVGIWVKFKIVKNKVAPPFKEGRFKIIFEQNPDDIGTNLSFLSIDQNGENAAKNKTTTIKLFGEEKTLSEWIHYIEDNNKEKELQQVVWETWQELHKTETRKPRIW